MGLILGPLRGTQNVWQPPLDGISNLYAVFGTKRLLSSHAPTSPIYTLRRTSDNATLDVYHDTPTGFILDWLGGSTSAVASWADQTGNGHHAAQATANLQPALTLTARTPCLTFTGTQSLILTNATGYGRNVGSLSLALTRRYNSLAATQYALTARAGTGVNARAGIGMSSAGLNFALGRREDADAGANPPGISGAVAWGVQTGRFDYATAKLHHSVDHQSETLDPFHDPGNTDDTAAVVGPYIGTRTNATAFVIGDLTMAAFVAGFMSDVENTAVLDRGRTMIP